MFSVALTQFSYAEKTLTVTQKCENTILQLFITNQDGKPVTNAKIFDRLRSDILAKADENGFLILSADLQGKMLRVGGGAYAPIPFTAENCQPYEIEFEKSDKDLMIINHHTWSNFDSTAEHGGGEYNYAGPTGNYIVGDIVNLSEHNLTDIKITITTFSERSGTIESKVWNPMKQILRPGEASPFFAYMGGNPDNYSIKIDGYKGTSGTPVTPPVKISDVVLSEDSKGNKILTITCTDTIKKSDDLRLLLMGYSENNFLETASLVDVYLLSKRAYNVTDCITDGKFTLYESSNHGTLSEYNFVEYAKNDRFEVFIIQSGLNLFYDKQETNRAQNLNAYENKPVQYSQTAVYSNYFPNSLTPKYLDVKILKGNPEKRETTNLEDLGDKLDSPSKIMPSWIKSNAEFWANDQIDDTTFVSGIQFLIKNGIINVPVPAETSQTVSNEIPSWIKSNAEFWAQGLISDDDFLSGIEYLVKQGIIKV